MQQVCCPLVDIMTYFTQYETKCHSLCKCSLYIYILHSLSHCKSVYLMKTKMPRNWFKATERTLLQMKYAEEKILRKILL